MTQNFGIFPDAPRYISTTPKNPVIKPILTQKGMCTTRMSHSSDAIYAPTKMRSNPIRITNALGSSFFFATPHSSFDFSYSSMSLSTTPFKVSTRNSYFRSQSFWYTSEDTRIMGYFFCLPGMIHDYFVNNINSFVNQDNVDNKVYIGGCY